MDDFIEDEYFQIKGNYIDLQNKVLEYNELLRLLLDSIDIELNDNESKLTKEDILKNLKKTLKEFIKNYRIKL